MPMINGLTDFDYLVGLNYNNVILLDRIGYILCSGYLKFPFNLIRYLEKENRLFSL